VSFNQGDFPQAENAYTHALAGAAANDPERADITERLAAAVYKQGESKRTAGDQAGAAEDFLRVARVAPGSKVIATSQYDAAAALINAQQWDHAIEVLEAYRRDYPKGNTAPMSAASLPWPMSRPAAPVPRPMNSSTSPPIRTKTRRWCAKRCRAPRTCISSPAIRRAASRCSSAW
jgi:tetratricopeptide (TPR) repeat protein